MKFCQKTKLKIENWKWNDFGGFQLPELREKSVKNCQICRFIFFETHCYALLRMINWWKRWVDFVKIKFHSDDLILNEFP